MAAPSPIDAIYREFRAGRISRTEAIQRMRQLAEITEAAAAKVLYNPAAPSSR